MNEKIHEQPKILTKKTRKGNARMDDKPQQYIGIIDNTFNNQRHTIEFLRDLIRYMEVNQDQQIKDLKKEISYKIWCLWSGIPEDNLDWRGAIEKLAKEIDPSIVNKI